MLHSIEKMGKKLAFLIICVIVVAGGISFVLSWKESNLLLPQQKLNTAPKSPATKESASINPDKYQAVFFSNGQVYFGKISESNQKYLTLVDIYYLRSNTSQIAQLFLGINNKDISLIKLGCELHGPEDKMIINRDKIDYWESLKNDSPTVKAIKEYRIANPKGQICPTSEPNNNMKIIPGRED